MHEYKTQKWAEKDPQQPCGERLISVKRQLQTTTEVSEMRLKSDAFVTGFLTLLSRHNGFQKQNISGNSREYPPPKNDMSRNSELSSYTCGVTIASNFHAAGLKG